jgi:acetyl-CoA C-acetyltransferase
MGRGTSWSGEVAIVGAYESPRRKAPGIHPFQIQAECVLGALEDAGLSLGDVDGLCSSASSPGEGGGWMDVCEVAEYLGIEPTFVDGTDTGGAAPIAQAGHAATAIAAGLADVVVVSYAGCSYSGGGDFDTLPSTWGPWAYEAPYGFTTVASYALAAQRHMHEFGTTPEQLAAIAVQCRANAGPNEHARYRDPITVEDVLASPIIASPLHRNDCCVVTDSGGAVVLVGKDRTGDASKEPAWLLGFGEAVGKMRTSQMSSFTETPGVASGTRAFEMAGVRPDKMDCAQLYDSFTITVLLALEDLGFCKKGEGGPFVEAGEITPEGSVPINTDGGGLSSNHPGRRGVFALIEAVRQLRGESPGVQLRDPKLAVAHGVGGQLSAAATMVVGV